MTGISDKRPLFFLATDQSLPLGLAFLFAVLKLIFRSTLLLLLLFVLGEGIARLAGAKPQDLTDLNGQAIISDSYTGWRLRPGAGVNQFGMRSASEVSIQKPKDKVRVAVAGSSVAFGFCAENDKQTIAGGIQSELAQKGLDTEGLNFGVPQFRLLHTVRMIESYVYRFNPDAVVLVMDMQMMLSNPPELGPGLDESFRVKKLSWHEALFKKASKRSALLASIDRQLSSGFRRAQIASLLPKAPASTPATPASRAVASPTTADDKVDQYRATRMASIRSLLASAAAFCRSRGIRLYVTSPMVPYYAYDSSKEMPFKETPTGEYMDSPLFNPQNLRDSMTSELALTNRVLREDSRAGIFEWIDMDSISRRFTPQDVTKYFCDQAHLGPAGYAVIAKEAAQQIYRGLGKRL